MLSDFLRDKRVHSLSTVLGFGLSGRSAAGGGDAYTGNLELEGDSSGNLELEGDASGNLELEGTS